MGGTPIDITGKTAFMTVVSERAKTAAVPASTVIVPATKHPSTNAATVLPALMLLEMEDAGDCSSSYCDEESSFASMSRRGSLLRKVGFASVEVREYAVTIGDHPCCTQGCPLSLDWEYEQGPVLTVDAFESTRSTQRRHRHDLLTSWEERRQILSQESVSEGEIRKAQRKLHRARSCNSRLCEKMSDAFFNSA